MNKEPMERFTSIIEDLEGLEKEFIARFKDLLSAEPTFNEDEMMEDIEGDLGENEVATENFCRVEEAINQFLEGELDEEQYLNVITDLLSLIKMTRQEYESSYISQEEWTVEVALGDKLLMEGLKEWEEALDFLSQGTAGSEDEVEENLTEGMERLFEANRKLVMVQVLARKVNEQASKMNKLKTGKSV